MPSRHWDQQAREARDRAKSMTSGAARQLMRDVVRQYRLMAAIASKRGRSRKGGRASVRNGVS